MSLALVDFCFRARLSGGGMDSTCSSLVESAYRLFATLVLDPLPPTSPSLYITFLKDFPLCMSLKRLTTSRKTTLMVGNNRNIIV